MEKAFFFKNNAHANLFGVLHYPEHRYHDTGLVMCAPFAEEKHESYRLFVNCARFLAQQGFAILRFDYYGTGDSDGDWHDATVNSRLSDIKSAIQFLNNEIANIKVGLLGLRFGATLAAITAENIDDLSFLILWQPIVNVKEYIYQCLRSNLTTQFILYNKILYNREALVKQLNQGQLINLDGFRLTKEMYHSASSINLLLTNLEFSSPVFIGSLENNCKSDTMTKLLANYQQTNSRVQLFKFEAPNFWQEMRPDEIFDMNPTMLFETTSSWLINSCGF